MKPEVAGIIRGANLRGWKKVEVEWRQSLCGLPFQSLAETDISIWSKGCVGLIGEQDRA